MNELSDKKKINKEEDNISISPKSFNEYFGQNELKKNLKVFLFAAKSRNEVLDHTFLYGPPGLGKTTLAKIIANEMGANLKLINGPSIEKSGDLASILSTLEPGDILFIDEIHRLPKSLEEILYSAMEDFKLNIISKGSGESSSISISLPPFTLVGATTRPGSLSSPLRARFGITFKFDFYSDEELVSIIKRTSNVLNIKITDNAAKLIASRSRGTPRIANKLLKRVRDFAYFDKKIEISLDTAKKSLRALKIDDLGLDDVDIKYLKTIIERFHGGPVGLEAIASSIGEEVINLEDVYEPYLVKIGMVNRTPRGRIATDKAFSYLKINL